jgi:hypothetical protein
VPLVFKTHQDSTERVDIVGAGVLFPEGKGGVVVTEAAKVLPELQEKNADGSLKLDSEGNAIPLTGGKLASAARDFADSRGFTTANLNEKEIDGLAAEAGTTPDPIPAAEAAKLDFQRVYGDGLETINDDPEVLVDSGPEDGAVEPPESTDTDNDNTKEN